MDYGTDGDQGAIALQAIGLRNRAAFLQGTLIQFENSTIIIQLYQGAFYIFSFNRRVA